MDSRPLKPKRQNLIDGKTEFFKRYKAKCKKEKIRPMDKRSFHRLFGVMAEVCFAEMVVEGKVLMFLGMGEEKIDKLTPELQRKTSAGRYIDKPMTLRYKTPIFRLNDHTMGNVYTFKFYPYTAHKYPLMHCWVAKPVEKLRQFFYRYLTSCKDINNLPYTLPERRANRRI